MNPYPPFGLEFAPTEALDEFRNTVERGVGSILPSTALAQLAEDRGQP